jgi:hypothetical protein
MTARQHGIASSTPNSDGNDEGGGKMMEADGEVGRCSGSDRCVSSLTEGGGMAVASRRRPSLGPVHDEKWAVRGAVAGEPRWG